MSTKGSRLSRAIQFFEDADIREARVAHAIVNEVMEKRMADGAAKPAMAKVRKPRKARVSAPRAAETPAPAEQATLA